MEFYSIAEFNRIRKKLRHITIYKGGGIGTDHCQAEWISLNMWSSVDTISSYVLGFSITLIIKGTNGERFDFKGEKASLEEAFYLADDYLNILSN